MVTKEQIKVGDLLKLRKLTRQELGREVFKTSFYANSDKSVFVQMSNQTLYTSPVKNRLLYKNTLSYGHHNLPILLVEIDIPSENKQLIGKICPSEDGNTKRHVASFLFDGKIWLFWFLTKPDESPFEFLSKIFYRITPG